MSDFPSDIIKKLEIDFAENAGLASIQLKSLVDKHDISERIVRCIIYLSKGSMDQLDYFISRTMIDWRDIIMMAEYDSKTDVQLRDFHKSFEENNL